MADRRFWLRTILTAALVAAPVIARAQSVPPPPTGPVEDPAETAKIKWGPVFLQPNFGFKNIGLDNNVFNDPVDPKQDWTGTVNMGMMAGLRFGLARLTVRTSSDYVYYAKFKTERSIDGNTRTMFEYRHPLLRPWIAMERVKAHERGGLEIDARAGRELPAYEAGLEFRPGYRLGIRLVGKLREIKYEEEEYRGVRLDQVLNAKYDEGALQFLYEISPLSSFRVSAEMSRARFDAASIRDSDDKAIFAGIEGRRDAFIQGYIDVGYRDRTPLDQASPAYSGWVARAAAAFILWDRMHIAFGLDRDIPWSYDEAYSFYVQQGGNTYVTIKLHDRFDVIASGRYYDLDYRDVIARDAVTRTDRVYGYGGGIGFFISGYPGTRIALMAERQARESIVPDRRYDTPRFYTNIGFSF